MISCLSARQMPGITPTGGTPFHLDLGDLPTWLLALFALGALVAALLAYRAQRKSLADQRKATAELARQATALADQAEAQRASLSEQQKVNALQLRVLERNLASLVRQQAERVSTKSGSWKGQIPGSPPESGVFHEVTVRNESDRPIRDVVCRLEGRQNGRRYRARLTSGALSLKSGPTWQGEHSYTKAAGGGSVRSLPARCKSGLVFPVGENSDVLVMLRFTDDAGAHWQVNDDLHLEQLAERDW